MTDARRLAAILAADVVGYSRLMGEDEPGTARAVRERREAAAPIVAANGGRLVKTMGDGVLLEFPSVVAAVECAIAIQTMMAERNAGLPDAKRMLYRVGVNLGDILIDGDDILGDGVNVAARLEGIAAPGGICLSEDAWRQVRDKMKETFVDLGEKSLKNIARPVRVYALRSGTAEVTTSASGAPGRPSPPRLSIVVLPFANLGGDPEQEYFVDGVTESLTTDLSRISGAFVIARNTAFTYKGKVVDVKQIGRELNVRYALEGSVQRGGGRMRVNVQLIETESGAHLWAERFDKPIVDLFDMQDEIVARLANQLQVELIDVEARRAERAPNPDSTDLVFQGRALLIRGASRELLAAARAFFERALELDPANVDALVGSAMTDFLRGANYLTDDPRPLMASAETKLAKALAMAPNHARAHRFMGTVLCSTNRVSRGMDEFERALAIDPNLAIAHASRGWAKVLSGHAAEAETHVLEALRLSPRDTFAYGWFLHVGGAKAYLGEWAQALPWLRKSIDANRNHSLPFFYLAACLAHLGRLNEARQEAQAGLAVDPKFTTRRFRAGVRSDNAVFVAQRERIIEGMLLAGVAKE